MDIDYYKNYEPVDGKWYITRELGRGAFGVVFEIERNDFGTMKSALKVISIPPSKTELDSFISENYNMDEKSISAYYFQIVEDFMKEINLMWKLKGYTNIVGYEDHTVFKKHGEIGWDIFMRMELLTPLNKYYSMKSAEGTLCQEDIIKLGIDICKALEICNKYNIIHRDIKTANIFVSQMGDYKLGDFGVARTLDRSDTGLSKKGTYTYMAPEVFKNEPYSFNVDLYSLGIVMYKLLNNNLEPFRENMSHESAERALSRRISGEEIPAPVYADEALSAIIKKACRFRKEERYCSATEMKEELMRLLIDDVLPSGFDSAGSTSAQEFEPSPVHEPEHMPDPTPTPVPEKKKWWFTPPEL